MPTSPGRDRLLQCLCAIALLALAAALSAPGLRCAASCFPDTDALAGRGLAIADVRLNAWILSWVQHALLTQPTDLFQANVFYPARDALAGSEHLIGLATLSLPLRLLTDNAVLIYQLTSFATLVLLGWTTAAFVRWLTGSLWIAGFAGAVAMVMPWRSVELSHLQLLGVHWFPAIWLLTTRILVEGGRRSDPIWLSVLLTLQLLTSFYLAYLLTLSIGVIVAVTAVLQRGLEWSRVLRAVAAAVPAYGLLLVVSIPYLARQTQGEIGVMSSPALGAAPGGLLYTLWFVSPRIEMVWSQSEHIPTAYSYPLSVFLLALAALALSLVRRQGSPPSEWSARVRGAIISLWACALAGLILMLGSRLVLGEFELKLPSYWLAQVVPGFTTLRAPHRWALLVSLTAPILAGLGLALVDRRLTDASGTRSVRRKAAVHAARAVLVILIVLNLPWRTIPAKPAWSAEAATRPVYAFLRDLPEGAVLELPWTLAKYSYPRVESAFMLATTLHHHPILNGFTAHVPPSYHFLRDVAQQLPAPEAMIRLQRLTDFRWIVVHRDRMPGPIRKMWREAERQGRLDIVYRDGRNWIIEVPRTAETGIWMADLIEPEPQLHTLAGLPRTALDPREVRGEIHVESAGPFFFLERARAARPSPGIVRVRVVNRSRLDWPGFDPRPEGLVEIRATFASTEDPAVPMIASTTPLRSDVPAGKTVTLARPILPPTRSGAYRLCIDLVQRLDGRAVPLPIPPREVVVEVEARTGKYHTDAPVAPATGPYPCR